MMDTAQKETFLEKMQKLYDDREAIFDRREQEYQKQKTALSDMLEKLRGEKARMEEKAEAQREKQKELDEKEKGLREQLREQTEERGRLEAEKKSLMEEKENFQTEQRMDAELAKNESIKARQRKEEYEHKIAMVDLLLEEADGEQAKASRFFRTFLEEGEDRESLEALEKENRELSSQKDILERRTKDLEGRIRELEEDLDGERDHTAQLKKELQEQADSFQKERSGWEDKENALKKEMEEIRESDRKKMLDLMLGLKKTEAAKASPEDIRRPEELAEDGREPEEEEPEEEEWEEEEPEEAAPQAPAEPAGEVYEEITPAVLQKYLGRHFPGAERLEIRHSADGEQVHLDKDGLHYAFIFNQPPSFEVSAPRRNKKQIHKLLEVFNGRYPDIKFHYEAGYIYATGYFVNSMEPEDLMVRVEAVASRFKR